jgi:diguanylate cyclase (GGDEF)-like protein
LNVPQWWGIERSRLLKHITTCFLRVFASASLVFALVVVIHGPQPEYVAGFYAMLMAMTGILITHRLNLREKYKPSRFVTVLVVSVFALSMGLLFENLIVLTGFLILLTAQTISILYAGPAALIYVLATFPVGSLVLYLQHTGVLGTPFEFDDGVLNLIDAGAYLVVLVLGTRFATLNRDRTKWALAKLGSQSEELKSANEQLHFLATHDPLTKLPNRRLYEKILLRAIDQAYQDNRLLAVMFIDLDSFKEINDSYGHHFGDQVLTCLAAHLREQLPTEVTLAHWSGDEFTLLLPHLDQPFQAFQQAEEILAAIAKPLLVGGEIIHCTASLGICLLDQPDLTADTLLRNADIAMYQAKFSGKNRWSAYSSETQP